jgi:hypothetical protein
MMKEQQKDVRYDNLHKLKHDIKNQLSNIHIALDQLKYEIPDMTADCLFYIDTIASSSLQINNLLKDTE